MHKKRSPLEDDVPRSIRVLRLVGYVLLLLNSVGILLAALAAWSTLNARPIGIWETIQHGASGWILIIPLVHALIVGLLLWPKPRGYLFVAGFHFALFILHLLAWERYILFITTSPEMGWSAGGLLSLASSVVGCVLALLLLLSAQTPLPSSFKSLARGGDIQHIRVLRGLAERHKWNLKNQQDVWFRRQTSIFGHWRGYPLAIVSSYGIEGEGEHRLHVTLYTQLPLRRSVVTREKTLFVDELSHQMGSAAFEQSRQHEYQRQKSVIWGAGMTICFTSGDQSQTPATTEEFEHLFEKLYGLARHSEQQPAAYSSTSFH